MPDATSDYASLMRDVRNTESMKNEIRRLTLELRDVQNRLAQTEQRSAALERTLAERDAALEEMRGATGDRGKYLDDKMKQKDETIARLQSALQAKHRELEDVKTKSAGSSIFRKK